jgi:hypothetical protein
MSKDLETFEEIISLLNEAQYPPANGAIAASNDPPRKDFGPVGGNGYPPSMKKGGLLDPYQQNPLASMPDPDRPASMPYPLTTINDFLADSSVYLDSALKMLKQVITSNPTLDPVFKQEVKKLYKEGILAHKAINKIGKNLVKVVNLNY